MTKENKYLYGWKLYVDYGCGWEYEVFEESRREILARVREYQESCSYSVKFNRGRELNPAYKPKDVQSYADSICIGN